LVAVPFLGPYAASKFALEAFSDSLRVELRPWGIPVSVIQMGAIHTPIWDKGLIYLENTIARHPERFLSLYGPVVNEIMRRVQPHGVTPAKVAQVVARALTAARPRPRYRMGWGAGLFVLLRLLPDRSRDWLISTQLPGWG
jgi:NAD(P)-dependent dehydrogenase (short-subunit alcohol dehydrogenase family)